MKRIYSRVRNWALKQSRNEGAIALTVRLLYKIFSNVFFQAIITIVDTIVIGLMTAFSYFGVFFWIAVVFFCISVILIAWAESYLREKVSESRNLKQSLYGIDIALRKWAILLQKCAKKLNSLSLKKNPTAVATALSDIDFQTAAFTVCEDLCEQLSKYYEKDDIYITVFQKYNSSNQEKCKMIAYSGNHAPSSYGQEYDIPEFSKDLLGKVEYHTYLFSKNSSEISVLASPESVATAFCLHQQCIERESKIQQYICVPISIAKLGIAFLLQIDTSVEFLFGKDESSVKNFAKNAIYPFAQFLHMIYEQGRTIEQLTKE